MKILNIAKYILTLFSIIFIFINWKISIWLFISGAIFHAIQYGPDTLLSVITGFLFIGGLVYLFIDWKIGIVLIISSGLVAKFRVWAKRINAEYYTKKEDQNLDKQ